MTAADIARAAFDELLSIVARRYRKADAIVKAGELLAHLEHDFEQALIRLQFLGMEATCIELQLQKDRQKREEEEAYEEGRRIGGFDNDDGDHIVVDVVDPEDTPKLKPE